MNIIIGSMASAVLLISASVIAQSLPEGTSNLASHQRMQGISLQEMLAAHDAVSHAVKADDEGNGDSNARNLETPVLVDATGKLVGRYIGRIVLLDYHGNALPLALGDEIRADPDTGQKIRTGYFDWNSYGIYYALPGCQGAPYGYPIYQQYGTRYVAMGIFNANTGEWTAYVYDQNNKQLVPSASELQYDAVNKTTTCYDTNGFGALMPPVDSFKLKSIGTPPLKVE